MRRSVLRRGGHVGYITTVSYPDRDLTAFSEGSPYREIVIADTREQHVALLQRYKEHWLVHCGTTYTTTDRHGELTDAQAMQLALAQATQPGRDLAALLKEQLDRMLPES